MASNGNSNHSPSESTWSLIEKTADHIWDSGLARDYKFQHRSSVVLTLLKGWELGLPLMSALEHVRIIHGHFSLSAECQQALVLARIPGAKFEWLADGKSGAAEVAAERPGHAKVRVKFTHEDAQKTGLADRNPIYKTFPSNLLRSAAMRNVCKRLFPDVLIGLDSAGEPVSEAEVADAAASVEAASVSPATQAREAPQQDAVERAGASVDSLENSAPEDVTLPFTGGKWAGLRLGQLDAEGLRTMNRGFTKRRNEAQEQGDSGKVYLNEQWLSRVGAWCKFRGVDLALESAAT